MKLTKRALCALLCLLLLVGMMPAALAVDAGGKLVPTDKPVLDVSRSKTATALTSDWTSQVTLALPSAETPNTIDVVFVVDNAFGAELDQEAEKASALLATLKNKASDTLNINVGLVISGGYIPTLKTIDLKDISDNANLTDLQDTIKDKGWKSAPGRKGSNIQAGIEAAREMLKNGEAVGRANKFIVLISDGGAFAWYKNGKAVSKFYANKEGAKDCYYWCNPSDFRLRYGEKNESKHKMRTFDEVMSLNPDLIDANSIAAYAVDEEGTEIGWPSSKGQLNNKPQYTGYYEYDQIKDYVDFKDCADLNTVTTNDNYVTSREAALYHTAKTLEDISEKDEANVIFVAFPYNKDSEHLYQITEQFKDYVAQKGYVTLYRDQAKYGYSTEPDYNVFDGINTNLIQLVDAGSTVVDKMGSAFDFGGLDTMTLTVNGQPLEKKPIDGVLYFGNDKDALSTTEYRFKVELTGTDTFTWTINEAVTREQPVELTYTVELVDRKTEEGTYEVPTNESAFLYPVDSLGQGDPAGLEFPVPTVTYTVDNSGNIILPVIGTLPMLWLNMDDHFSYIVGYPDGTVQPNGKITRAEVATIFFRLLSDDTREAFWSSTNDYSDVPADKWYNNAVSTLSRLGVISGYPDGTFRPDASITRAEFAKIAVSFCKYGSTTYSGCFSDVKASDWFSTCVETARNSNLIAGYPDGTFRPNNAITRAEACTIVNRTLGRKPAKNHMAISGRINWPDCLDTEWFYADMMEATNSHDYQMVGLVEDWNRKLPQRDWAALETEWSHAYSAPGGEVGR